MAILPVRSRKEIFFFFYWCLREEENRQSSIVQPTWNNNLCLETLLFISSKEETDQFLPKSNEMVPTSICFQIPPPPFSHTLAFTFQLPHGTSAITLYLRETKKDLQMMNSQATCLNCPPSVWLSASFTPAIFFHFANLPTRWEGAGKLLKVLWLQMSGPDVPLFLKWACDFIFICFQLFAPTLTPAYTHVHTYTHTLKHTPTTVDYWTHTYICMQIKSPLRLAPRLAFI